MALLFMDGLDKFGPANSNSTAVAALLTAGEWTTTAGTPTIVAGLSATGFALLLGSSGNITKTLPSAVGRLIGGMRFSSTLAGGGGVQLLDGASQQCGVVVNTTGTVSVRQGSISSGTVLGTSASSITANTTHYLEWDITFANAGSYQVWMDGVSVLSGSGDTTATANNTVNGCQISSLASNTMTVDDLYVFDATGTTNNAALLTSPRIETQFPTSDGAVQFALGAGILGSTVSRTATNVSSTANQLRLRAVTPSTACTLNSIGVLAATASGTVNLRPVVYSSSAGAPGTLLGSGSTVTGTTAATAKTMPLTSGVALSAGTQYFIGFMCDIAVTTGFAGLSSTTDDFIATSTFASGAPGTAPAMSAAAGTVTWGNVSGQANWATVDQNPNDGSFSYVFDATVGHEELYGFPVLSAPPSAIYAVAVKASLAKSDAGAKTASVRLKSSTTDSAGTGGTALAPGTSFGWMTSVFERDPNGSIAWTKTALDAAQAGVKVET